LGGNSGKGADIGKQKGSFFLTPPGVKSFFRVSRVISLLVNFSKLSRARIMLFIVSVKKPVSSLVFTGIVKWQRPSSTSPAPSCRIRSCFVRPMEKKRMRSREMNHTAKYPFRRVVALMPS
jgi:hypothetical protein